MSTNARSELSKRNPYWLDRHRYYELKHFCLQYRFWKEALASLDGFGKNASLFVRLAVSDEVSDPTARCVEAREFYSGKIEMLEKVAEETDHELGGYVLTGVALGVPYDVLKAKLNIPCGKELYYKLYRRFFWLLSKARG